MKKFFMFAVVAMMSACGIQDSSSHSELSSLRSRTIEFTGKDGDLVFEALQQMDVIDTIHLVGAANLYVEALRCSQLVYAPAGQEAPRCEFSRGNLDDTRETVTVGGMGAVTMMEVLARHGAVVNGGINANAVAAKSLQCSLGVYPNAVARCVIKL